MQGPPFSSRQILRGPAPETSLLATPRPRSRLSSSAAPIHRVVGGLPLGGSSSISRTPGDASGHLALSASGPSAANGAEALTAETNPAAGLVHAASRGNLCRNPSSSSSGGYLLDSLLGGPRWNPAGVPSFLLGLPALPPAVDLAGSSSPYPGLLRPVRRLTATPSAARAPARFRAPCLIPPLRASRRNIPSSRISCRP